MHERTIKIERIMKASAERIWRCWCEPKLFEQWYCPKPWTAKLMLQELRNGGKLHLKFEGPDGAGFEKHGLILECIPNQKMVFTDAFVDSWEPSNRALHVISFEPVSYTHLDVYKRQEQGSRLLYWSRFLSRKPLHTFRKTL